MAPEVGRSSPASSRSNDVVPDRVGPSSTLNDAVWRSPSTSDPLGRRVRQIADAGTGSGGALASPSFRAAVAGDGGYNSEARSGFKVARSGGGTGAPHRCSPPLLTIPLPVQPPWG